jgi:hypothetical protein
MPEVQNSPSVFLPETITADNSIDNAQVTGTPIQSGINSVAPSPGCEPVEAALIGVPAA